MDDITAGERELARKGIKYIVNRIEQLTLFEYDYKEDEENRQQELDYCREALWLATTKMSADRAYSYTDAALVCISSMTFGALLIILIFALFGVN